MCPARDRGRSGTPDNDELADLAGRLRLPIMRLARHLRRHTVTDLTPAQFSVLARVAEFGPVSLGRLAEIEVVKPPTITRIVAALEERGLIQREESDPDRRKVTVSATSEGWHVLARIRARRDTFLAARLAELSPAEIRRLEGVVTILERLAEQVRPDVEVTE